MCRIYQRELRVSIKAAVTCWGEIKSMESKLNVELVKQEIERFWKAVEQKDSKSLLRFYAGGATVFSSSSKRHELGPLSATRRQREYFQRDSRVKADIGNVHVIVLGEHAESAVASYTFQLQASHVATMIGETD